MSIIDIIDVIVFYGIDVAALAFATAFMVQVLKKTVLKNAPNKLYTFLPFIIGTFMYAVYETVYHLDWQYCFCNFVSVLEHGATIGALATFLYVLYEQFIRKDEASTTLENVIASILEGYVCEESVQETARLIAEAIESSAEDGGQTAFEIIKDNSSETASDEDLQLLAKLISKTLATLSVAN